MPAPSPLTACHPPQLDWSRPAAPAARDFDDIYFSVDGGLAETEAVYLAGCGLPERWGRHDKFSVAELGFGSGLNFLATWRLWDTQKPKDGHLHFVSVEKFPFSQDDLKQALSAWPELSDYAAGLIKLWPGPVKGMHRLHVASDVTLTLLHDDVLTALETVDGTFDAWFLDGFSPAKNPDMWSEAVVAQVGHLSAPGATIGTFTVAGHVRTVLKAAGFDVVKKEGFGRKRHRLEAVYPGHRSETSQHIHPVIVGAGIAGASLARAFLTRGIRPVIVDPSDGTAASANPAAIVKPRLDLQDRPESRFFLSSYLYALNSYLTDGSVLSRGVFHAAQSEKDVKRFLALANNAALPEAHMRFEDGPYGTKGLYFPQALVLDPVKTLQKFTLGAEPIRGRAFRVTAEDGCLHVKSEDGKVLATGSHVFLTLGAGVKTFTGTQNLGLRYSRGQVTGVSADIEHAITYGGYAIPMYGDTLLGATHARLTSDDPYVLLDVDDHENVEKFKAISGKSTQVLKGKSRASVRVTTPNTLPLVSEVMEGVTALTGLGSRGFVFAPLLAEDVVSQICQEPSALSKQQRQTFRRERSPT